MRVLVVGFLEYDSGKTSLMLSLAKKLKNKNFMVAKPIAGHSAWHQYETVINSFKLGLLVGEDAYKLASTIGKIDMLHLINPIDLLITPLDPLLARGEAEKPLNIALMRTTEFEGGKISTEHYICYENIRRSPLTLRKILVKLAKKLDAKPLSYAECYDILMKKSDMIANKALKEIYDNFSLIAVESFNNVAFPCTLALEVDYVLAVSPGKVVIYKGEEYNKAVKIYSSIMRLPTLTVNEISRYLKPIQEFNTPPLPRRHVNAYKEVLTWIEKKIKY